MPPRPERPRPTGLPGDRGGGATVETASPATASPAIVVGRVSGVFGVRGWLRIRSYTDPPGNILGYGPWLVGDGDVVERRVVEGALHGRGVIAHLEGIDDRDVARTLIGADIRVPRERLGDAGRDAWFWSDLVGKEVLNEAGISLGRVADMIETGANDVMVVLGERRRLVPFVPGRTVRSVDLAGGVIRVVWEEDY